MATIILGHAIRSFDFKRDRFDGPITSVRIQIQGKRMQSEKIYIDILKHELARYRPESEYATFKPVAAICHAYIWGWDCGYETVFYNNIEDFEKMKGQSYVSEPTGKYFQRRKEYVITKF